MHEEGSIDEVDDRTSAFLLDVRRDRRDAAMPHNKRAMRSPMGERAAAIMTVARQLAVKVAARARDFSSKFPTIKVSKDT